MRAIKIKKITYRRLDAIAKQKDAKITDLSHGYFLLSWIDEQGMNFNYYFCEGRT